MPALRTTVVTGRSRSGRPHQRTHVVSAAAHIEAARAAGDAKDKLIKQQAKIDELTDELARVGALAALRLSHVTVALRKLEFIYEHGWTITSELVAPRPTYADCMPNCGCRTHFGLPTETEINITESDSNC